MVDGTSLKGKHKGILLSTVGKDGNEGTIFTSDFYVLFSCTLQGIATLLCCSIYARYCVNITQSSELMFP